MLKLFLFIAAAVPLSIFRAFVGVMLWGWFAVGLFDAAPLSIAQVWGAVTLIGFATYRPPEQFDDDDVVGLMLIHATLNTLISWLFGWIAALVLGVA